jgi:hypothetical protein
MSNVKQITVVMGLLIMGGALLTGCASELLGVNVTHPGIGIRGVPQSTPPHGPMVSAQGSLRAVNVGGNVSASLQGSNVSNDYGDWDWIHVTGLSDGDQLGVLMTASGSNANFDVGITRWIGPSDSDWDWYHNGSTKAFDDSIYSHPKSLWVTVDNSNDTWIFVGAWEGSSGDYTVTVTTKAMLQNYGSQPPSSTPSQSNDCDNIKSSIQALSTANYDQIPGLIDNVRSYMNSAGDDAWVCVEQDAAMGLTFISAFGEVASQIADNSGESNPLSAMSDYIGALFSVADKVKELLPILFQAGHDACASDYAGVFHGQLYPGDSSDLADLRSYWLAGYLCYRTPAGDWPT